MSHRPHISLIVAALSPNLGIGAKGKLPWRLKQEIKYFKDVTSKCSEGSVNAVIMGRKTWESIPNKFRPLPSRVNVILSRSHTNTTTDNVLMYNSLDAVLDHFSASEYVYGDKRIEKIFIIGGAQVYNSVISDSRVDSLLLTNVEFTGDTKNPEMDTFLNWDLSSWSKQSVQRLREMVGVEFTEGKIQEGDFLYEYGLWERKRVSH